MGQDQQVREHKIQQDGEQEEIKKVNKKKEDSKKLKKREEKGRKSKRAMQLLLQCRRQDERGER